MRVKTKLPYYRAVNGNGYWVPRRWLIGMKGFEARPLGKDGPEAWSKAKELYENARIARSTGDQPIPKVCPYKQGSLGHFWWTWKDSVNFLHGRKPRTREEFHTAWLKIGPILGNKMFSELTVATCQNFHNQLEDKFTAKVRHRAMAKLGTIIQAAIAHGLMKTNPLKAIRNRAPKPRYQTWWPKEIATLINTALSNNMTSMSLIIRLIYECGFSPVDARTVSLQELHSHNGEYWIELDRAKTAVGGIWEISKSLHEDLLSYVNDLGAKPMQDVPFLRRPDGQPWRDGTHFSKDFREVRAIAFGQDEKRQALDIRRTYNVEMDLGEASPEERAAMMANSLDKDPNLDRTYTPPTLEKAKSTLKKREIGKQMRIRAEEQNRTNVASYDNATVVNVAKKKQSLKKA